MVINNAARLRNHSLPNADLAVEPEGLSDFTPLVHQYLGDLPEELCLMFVAINQMNVRQFAFVQGNDQNVTEACHLFRKKVVHFFNLPEGAEFQVLTGFKVALITKSSPP